MITIMKKRSWDFQKMLYEKKIYIALDLWMEACRVFIYISLAKALNQISKR